MSPTPLENLASAGQLQPAPADERELRQTLDSALLRLTDARRTDLSITSRFDLAYNAAYGLAAYALRRCGFRALNRYIVFQVLEVTGGLGSAKWRVLAKAHELRNRAHYEGDIVDDERLVEDMILILDELAEKLSQPGKASDHGE